MKKLLFLFAALQIAQTSIAQSEMKEVQGGVCFHISVPNYMSRTTGLNQDAVLQYKSVIKDVYTLVIEDNFEELKSAELNFTSFNEYAENVHTKFLQGEKDRKLSSIKYKKTGNNQFAEFDASYTDSEDGMQIYYLFGLVETKTAFYKILSWTTESQKETFIKDFQAILYSFKE